jgi:hypothetical protein
MVLQGDAVGQIAFSDQSLKRIVGLFAHPQARQGDVQEERSSFQVSP